jgi:hypothetical protein
MILKSSDVVDYPLKGTKIVSAAALEHHPLEP